MPPDVRTRELAAAIRGRCRGEVLEEGAGLRVFGRDFGGMVERTPSVVVRPASCEDVAGVLQLAGEYGVPVTTRGTGHSQSGQGLGRGIVVDMTSLDRVLAVRADDAVVEAEGGASWRSVVDSSFEAGFLPRALTHAMDPSVGGTLSVGGVGGESFRCGPQVDNVLALDVATLRGEIVHSCPSVNRSLFDAVRAGVGQCGVIVRARYPLRPCKRFMTARAFAYTDVRSFLDDATTLSQSGAEGRWLAGTVVRAPFMPDRLVLVLRVAEESDTAHAPRSMGVPGTPSDLPPWTGPTWQADGAPGHRMFQFFGGGSAVQPHPSQLNPWIESVFSTDQAGAVLEWILSRGCSSLPRGGTGIILVRRGPDPAPLFSLPPGELLVGIGLFQTFPFTAAAEAESSAIDLAGAMQRFGGKRYLSGFFPDAGGFDWGEHYGKQWPRFHAAKAEHDPTGLLGPGFIEWA